ncbi:MAG: hypothetical protein KO318_09515 [Methanobacterium sp.]|jgi:hypothetical protein|uniref:hypothetical protein n=1 Tax=Methanobacterium sp. TaxID=2164 RepID=UPI002585EDBB|nr:hypothetical protein [Methanobacterium sp.]MCC7560646.1 hypothetical protein [Methanobacterium sp.]
MFSLREEYINRLTRILKGLENSRIEGLDSVIMDIKNIEELGFYEKIYNAFYMGSDKLAPETRTSKEKYLLRENYMDSNFQKMGYKNLSMPPLHIPIITDLICFPTFLSMYPFLQNVYYINLDRPMDAEDFRNLYASRIDERLAYYLNEFDEIIESVGITDEFFIKLKDIKWENRDSKQLFDKLKESLKCVRMKMFGKFHIIFSKTERDFILFLSACSSIKNYRDRINQNDVIMGYKTYFKLIKTDITNYESTLKSEADIVDNGYLVCDKCFEYYKLQPGESSDDFIDECECGGKLKYFRNLDW